MAKVNRVQCKAVSKRHSLTPCTLPSCSRKNRKDLHSKKKHSTASEKKDWESASCSVCLEYPHNAVLLLCSSYKKGCRPYMCSTSCRFSNCLGQYKKAYTKITSMGRDRTMDNSTFSSGMEQENKKIEVSELLCPLCRGQVKGWTVVEPARKYFNAKKRVCMQDDCAFLGTYKELRKHVRAEHPSARPRAVDPVLEENWNKLERERERNDIISTIISSTPGAMVVGDYVIEPGYRGNYNDYDYDSDSDDSLDGFLHLESLDRGQSNAAHYRDAHLEYDLLDGDDYGMHRPVSTGSTVSGHGLQRIVLGSRRRRRRRYRGGNRSL